MKNLAKSLMQRIELATDHGRCGLSLSRQVWAAVRCEGICETDAAAKCRKHASLQTSGASPEGKSEMLGRVN